MFPRSEINTGNFSGYCLGMRLQELYVWCYIYVVVCVYVVHLLAENSILSVDIITV